MKIKVGSLLVWILLFAIVIVALQKFSGGRDGGFLEHQEFQKHVNDGRVAEVKIDGNRLQVTLNDGTPPYDTIGPTDDEAIRFLSEKGVLVTWGQGNKMWWTWGVVFGVLVLLILFFAILGKKQSGGIFNLGKSRARLIAEKTTTFADVGGLDRAKERFADIIDYLKHSSEWDKSGARCPRGVLLVGPPGCGKTLIARAVAGEAGVPFFTISASEFVEMFVGVGAARVRDMFDVAKKKAPAIVFVDELDAVGRRRGSGIGSAHDEREQTLNQLLVALDGFDRKEHVVVIAATNRPDVLDSALLRPGRFDVRIAVELPNQAERLETLRIHTANKTLASDVSLEVLASKTHGFSGADIENLANEATLVALRTARLDSGRTGAVKMADFNVALSEARAREGGMDRMDAVLLESASQLAQPTGMVRARLTLTDDSVVEGNVVWADALFIKLVSDHSGEPIVISKGQIRKLEALPGTEACAATESVGDVWAHRVTELG